MITHAEDVLKNRSLTGSDFCDALTKRTDAFLKAIYEDAVPPLGTAVLAIGGYGRKELCPGSDIDVVLVHEPDVKVNELAEKLWYPLWDAGLKLGHQVGTVNQLVEVAYENLDMATSLLACRLIAGDKQLAQELIHRSHQQWASKSSHYLAELNKSVISRHQKFGEVAFLLEPDLKEARGGLRDVHVLKWVEESEQILRDQENRSLEEAFEKLLEVRIELHRETGRRSDRLSLELQDDIAARLGYDDADQMMSEVATAARVIAWTGDGAHRRISRLLRDRGPRRVIQKVLRREVEPGLILENGRIQVTKEALEDPLVVLRSALAAAENNAYLDRSSLETLSKGATVLPDPWPKEARNLFERLLLTGWPAIQVIEDLDQSGLFVPLIPEWAPCQSLPQRNAYHRFTVDRHLLEAAAQASLLEKRVDRPDLLVVGALLHDIGKGYPGDHSEVGVDLVVTIAGRMGYSVEDVGLLSAMVEQHLLLPDVATRRDLDDDGTIRSVAATVGNIRLLRLLWALTEADSIATGPSAWSHWKDGLVTELVARVTHVLEGGDVLDVIGGAFPNEEQKEMLLADEDIIRGEGSTFTVVTKNRSGIISKVAGVLALNGISVFGAAAHTENDRSLSVFRVERRDDQEIKWELIAEQTRKAFAGQLAVAARLGDRSRFDRRTQATARPVQSRLTVDNETSEFATVLEISCLDETGILYRITRAFTELDLDIVSARVQTLGSEVIDAFYIRDQSGNKIEDPEHLAEIELAVLRWIDMDL
ncbi:MAG: [protein-PII] uridylyltransferase [Actinomycetota bacterium]|nr:[protein-PII] uridylyltransferase [Actinomycetota bacterium]